MVRRSSNVPILFNLREIHYRLIKGKVKVSIAPLVLCITFLNPALLDQYVTSIPQMMRMQSGYFSATTGRYLSVTQGSANMVEHPDVWFQAQIKY